MTTPTSSSTTTHGHVLVVEDDPRIAAVARDYLADAGFSVDVVDTGAAALSTVARRVPDLVVLDLGLPDLDGLDVARDLRRGTAVPIVMLTARTDELDRILGLEVGADDYVVKPFSPRELVARVRAVLRRVELDRRPDDRPLRVGPVLLDPATRQVTVDDEPVDLTATEFDLVAVLLSQPGRVFTRSQLLDAVHGASFDSYERAVDAHVKNIRRKLESTPDSPRLLQTVHGVGYRFVDG
ncbi:response regulator transcription factor [Salsipaludibacter albus]|uniref:response regulator transcription factor n=1 Tax=Salsipaludibacter albus TaxID=2849650 RepID=UPI001EE478F1|nr:response regulator transcription factor [Salsipaludibacter albus]MBY5163480.1 response regulator transcription factor [Salsipaludibacter albus]